MDDKISQDDGLQDVITKLSEGNPGAITSLTEVMNEREPLEFFNFALKLDVLRIYGPDIWIGYKDYCDQNATEFYDSVMESESEIKEYIESNN